MPDETTYTFRLIDDTAGGAGGKPAGGPGVPPVVGPGVNPRTAQREQAESLAGGPAEVVEKKQDRQEKRRQPKPPKPPVAVRSPFGEQLAGRLGLGGIVGAAGPAGAAIAVVAAGAVAIRQTDAHLRRQADRAAPFSPELAQARAQIGLERTLADIRFARQFGGDLADIERARARVGRASQRAFDLAEIGIVRATGAASNALLDNLDKNLEKVSPAAAAAIRALRSFLGFKTEKGGTDIFLWWQKQKFVLPPGFKDLGEAADVEFDPDLRDVPLPAFPLP